jgi:hypothetical protein
MSSRCCRSPVSTARWSASSAARVWAGETTPRGRPAATCARARWAIWRGRGRALVDGFGDLVVLQIEHLAQHEHRPLGRRERLQHQQHRHRDAVGQLDVLGHIGRGQQRLGQPGADVGLFAAAERSQPVERLAGGDPDQVRPLILYGVEVDADPPHPGLLQDVLRVGGRAEHLVGDGEQQVVVGEERLGGGVHGTATSERLGCVHCSLAALAHRWLPPVRPRLCHTQDAGPHRFVTPTIGVARHVTTLSQGSGRRRLHVRKDAARTIRAARNSTSRSLV